MILAKFFGLIKDCQDFLTLEQELMRLMAAEGCRQYAIILEAIDTELVKKLKRREKVEILRRDRRTVLTMFGTLTFTRHLVRKPGGKAYYPLDRHLGLVPYQRYSPLLLYSVAKVASGSAYRATAEAVNTLTSVSISAQLVGKMVKTVGTKYAQYEEMQAGQTETDPQPQTAPEYLYVEGDGVMLQEQHTKERQMEMHRFQAATGVEQIGKRRILTGLHVVAGLDRKQAMERMRAYLEKHYDLSKCIVLSNSDGGSGYTKEVFEELTEGCKENHYFRDRYHVNEKIRQRLSFLEKKKLVSELQRSVWRHDWEKVEACLDTSEGEAKNTEDVENVAKLRAYLKRSWDDITPLWLRPGLKEGLKGIGTCESNHRIYTYRMKSRGRCWSRAGGLAMIKVITGLKNGDLERAMVSKLEGFRSRPGKDFSKAVKMALKKIPFQAHEGVCHGRIANYGPSSSPMGRLAQSLCW